MRFKDIISWFKGYRKFIPIYENIFDQIKKGKLLTSKGGVYKKSSWSNYATALLWLQEYEKQNEVIYFEDIDVDWLNNFIIFLIDNELAQNSIKAIITRIKAVAYRINKNLDLSEARVQGEITTATYNTIEDIRTLLHLDLSNKRGLERVRDAYVLHCFLGLRFQDFRELLTNIQASVRQLPQGRFFSIKTRKTDIEVFIPIAKIIAEILARRNYSFGKRFTYQYYNDSIKEVAQLAGLASVFIKTITRGGVRTDNVLEKWQVMSSHTARRSFATNAYLSGIPIAKIMLITGHTTEESFRRYLRMTGMESAISISQHDFFSLIFNHEIGTGNREDNSAEAQGGRNDAEGSSAGG
jgi:hypothetical protein